MPRFLLLLAGLPSRTTVEAVTNSLTGELCLLTTKTERSISLYLMPSDLCSCADCFVTRLRVASDSHAAITKQAR